MVQSFVKDELGAVAGRCTRCYTPVLLAKGVIFMDDMGKAELRAKLNREVSHLLSRHAVDMKKAHFSCTTDSVDIRGHLQKEPYDEFCSSDIHAMCADLREIRGLKVMHFDLDNWFIDGSVGYARRMQKYSR